MQAVVESAFGRAGEDFRPADLDCVVADGRRGVVAHAGGIDERAAVEVEERGRDGGVAALAAGGGQCAGGAGAGGDERIGQGAFADAGLAHQQKRFARKRGHEFGEIDFVGGRDGEGAKPGLTVFVKQSVGQARIKLAFIDDYQRA